MLFRLLRLILVLALVVSAPPSFNAMAQALGQGAAGLITDQQKAIQGLTAKTDDLEKKIQQDGEDDASLVDIRLQLEDLSRAALTSALAFRSRLTDINKRIEMLGPPPAAGQASRSGC
jgi:potassium efflux system protein